jgi:hypothetical protein
MSVTTELTGIFFATRARRKPRSGRHVNNLDVQMKLVDVEPHLAKDLFVMEVPPIAIWC